MHAGLVNSGSRETERLIRELENRDRKEKEIRKRKRSFAPTNNVT